MKILQVTPTFVPSKFGGVKAVSYNLSKTLADKGLKVTVYTTDADIGGSRLRHIHAAMNVGGINVRYFRNLSNLLAFKYRLFLPVGMVLAAKSETGSFDIIHLHDFRGLQNIIVHHYAKKYNVPYVLQAHGSLRTFFQKGWLKRTFDAIWGYRILRDASKVIAVTNSEVEQYKSLGINEDKIEIVRSGIDLSEFDNLPERGKFRKKYGLNDSQKIILYLGRIHKIKGLDLLVTAFTELSKHLNEAKLVIVGPDDGYLSSLKKLVAALEISNKVLFTGPLCGQEKLRAYVDADVYVLPSFYEIYGITVLEAMACGIPVIVTDRCGIADVIGGQAGLVVPYDKEQLQHALLHVLSDDKMRLQFSEKGRSLVGERFSWAIIAQEAERVYQKVLLWKE